MADDNKKLSGAEERERLKQVYLKELRLRKAFLKKMRSGRQLSRVANEMEKLVAMQQDDTDQWIRKLEEGNAVDEAKLEIALEKMRMTDLNDVSGTAELGETTESPTEAPLSKADQAKAALAKFMVDEGLADNLPAQKKTLGGGLVEDNATKTLGIDFEEDQDDPASETDVEPDADATDSNTNKDNNNDSQ